MSDTEINDVIESLEEVKEDSTVPKNVRIKIDNIIATLKDSTETSIKISKALSEIDDIADDVNLQSYTRTQIWNVVSILEKINE